ncbi:hypothetical protein ABZ901_04615, partial [Actinacidiphila alni]|uniref:hypothetical protein n=1 Tax=Actinacidiphila alni TaxID=380248 RepID=UPI0033F2DB05
MYDGAAVRAIDGDGSGRSACTTTKTIASSTTSGVQILNRRAISTAQVVEEYLGYAEQIKGYVAD